VACQRAGDDVELVQRGGEQAAHRDDVQGVLDDLVTAVQLGGGKAEMLRDTLDPGRELRLEAGE
jgi:hypothetical protein